VRLDVRGHPLHTRALSLTLTQRSDGKLDASAGVLDLRKRGFVPIAGDLQPSGIVHDMRLGGIVDPSTRALETIDAEQRSVAFEPSAVTHGESCRDPIANVAALAGARLDDGWARRVGAEIGGVRGCSHLLTLAHLLGSSAAWALAREAALHGGLVARRAGERVFRRDVVVDGHEPADGRMQLAAQLTDVHFQPAPAVALPLARLAAQTEVRVLVEVEFPAFTITRVTGGERRRGPADLDTAAWRDRGPRLAWLVGDRLGSGIAARLLAQLGAALDERPLLDTLLMLAPALVQCAAAMSDAFVAAARAAPSLVGVGGLDDSCYMWRRDGALACARADQRGTAPRRP
jgi:hypothetical protein